tara:strand:+ start:876 stop:1043 length:168 start_codon:yes stop_codon:yes gene_type:complete
MKKYIFLFFLTACAIPQKKDNKDFQVLNFDKDFTFNEYRSYLEEYNLQSDYPNLD